jgi:hypothetical protein
MSDDEPLPMDDTTRNRIKAAGKWAEFQAYRAELQGQGYNAKESWQLAARSALGMGVPTVEPVPVVVPASDPATKAEPASTPKGQRFSLKDFGDDWQPDTAEAIRFVAMALHAVDVEPVDAPNPEGANLLIWARRTAKNEDQFWQSIYPKLVTKSELEAGGRSRDLSAPTLAILEDFERFTRDRLAKSRAEGSARESGLPPGGAGVLPIERRSEGGDPVAVQG